MRSPSTAPAAGLASALSSDTACSRALAAAVAASAPAPHPDAALIAIGQQWRIARQEWVQHEEMEHVRTPQESDAAGEATHHRERDALAGATRLPAASILGLAVKIRMLAVEADCPDSDDAGIIAWAAAAPRGRGWLEDIVASLCFDLLRPMEHDGSVALAAMLLAPARQDGTLLQIVAAYWTAEMQRKAIYAAAGASFRRQNAIDEGAPATDVERAEAAAGIDRFHDRANVVEGRQNEMIRTLAVTPAATAEGLRGKALVAIDDMTDGKVAWLTSEHIPELLSRKAQATDIHPARNLALVMSVLADAARIGMPPAGAVEAEASL